MNVGDNVWTDRDIYSLFILRACLKTEHYPLWNKVKFIDRDLPSGTSKADFGLLTSDVGLPIVNGVI